MAAFGFPYGYSPEIFMALLRKDAFPWFSYSSAALAFQHLKIENLKFIRSFMLHLPKLAAVGTLGFVSRDERQGADAQHASGRELSMQAQAHGPSPTLTLELEVTGRVSTGHGPG